MNQNTRLLGDETIGRLLFRLSTPATIGMMVMALYNIVDTIFVGQGVGPMAIAGLTIVFPIQMIVTSVAQTLGIGGASIISRSLGSNDPERASRTLGNLTTLMFVLSVIFTPVLFLLAEPILFLFGAKGDIVRYARDYFEIIIIGFPLLSYAMMNNNIVRAEGNARFAMIVMIVAAVINIILDPIFIFGLELGVKGAAWASVISYLIAMIHLFYYFTKGGSMLRIRKKYFRPDRKILWETVTVGSSSFVRQVSGSVVAAILNHSLVAYGGEIAVAIFGVIHRILMVTFMPLLGIVQGFLPITGYNYGAENYERVKQTLRISSATATLFSILGFLMMMLFAPTFISVFSNEQELVVNGAEAMRYIILAFPLIGFQVIGSGYFQALGKALPAFFLSVCRQVLFLIPLVLILPLYFGLDGIWFAFPLADTMAFLVTLVMLLPQFRQLSQWINNKKAAEK